MENSRKNNVLSASIIYVIVSLVNKGIGIITIPIFTRLLSASEMGVVSIWTSWLLMITPIATLSLMTGSFYIAMNQYPKERDKYQSSVLFLSTVSSITCFILYFIFKDLLNKLFTLDTGLMVFMFVYLVLSPSMDIWLLRKRYEYETKKMAIVSLISSLLSSIVALLLVIILKDKNYNLGNVRVYGTYGILAIFSLFFYILIIKKGKVLFDKNYWRFGLSISIPLIFHSLAKNILDVSDKSMISFYCGKEAVGIYGTVYSISTLSLIVWTAINNAFVPYLFESLSSEKDDDIKNIGKASYIMIGIYAVVCLGLTMIAPEIVRLLTTDSYYEAIYIIPPVAAGIFLTCVYNLFANVILFHKKSTGVMVGTIIAAVTNVVLNAIFIPIFGYIAAAYTTLTAYVVLSIIQGIIMINVHKKPLYNMKIIFILSFFVIGICLSFTILYKKTIIRYIVIAVSVLIFSIVSITKRKQIMAFIKERGKKKVINS